MKQQLKPLLAGAAALLAWCAAGPATAADGAALLQNQCASCHALAKPEATGVDRILQRKGPDLHYAGAKFNRDWLVNWLKAPSVIRPAGVLYTGALKPGSGGTPDSIDAARLTPHPQLGADDAAAVADALMKLGAGSDLVQKGAFKQEPVNKTMATMLFNKFRGCGACHSAAPGSGGVSGPQLYAAGNRLQADFMVEYIRNPQKFDPHVWMPKLELSEADVQKLAGYLTTLKQEGAK